MMKKLVIALGVLFFACTMTQAQDKKVLKGPKAKNKKAWKKNKKPIVVYTVADRKPLVGPKAKNVKPGIAKGERVSVIIDDKKLRPKGPSAKNSKPWK